MECLAKNALDREHGVCHTCVRPGDLLMSKFRIHYHLPTSPPPAEYRDLLIRFQGCILEQRPDGLVVAADRKRVDTVLAEFSDWRGTPVDSAASAPQPRRRLSMVYGFIATPDLLVVDSAHVIVFDDTTRVIGIEIEQVNENEFLTISPFDLDEGEFERQYKTYLQKLVAEVEEMMGDGITASQRNSWERKLRQRAPKILVGVKQI